jgi:hypothetical protein
MLISFETSVNECSNVESMLSSWVPWLISRCGEAMVAIIVLVREEVCCLVVDTSEVEKSRKGVVPSLE